MGLEIILLSEVSQTENDKYPKISFMCGIYKRNDAKEHIQNRNRNRLTDINKFMVTKEQRWRRARLGICD